MEKPAVLLIHCGNRTVGTEETANKNLFFMPIGFLSLGSACRLGGLDCCVLHTDLDDCRAIDWSRYSAVGLDLHWINQAYSVITLCARIKRECPDIFVFLGGYSASLYSDELLESHPEINAVICGFGEEPMLRLCTVLSKGTADRELSKVPNLKWRNGERTVDNGISYLCDPDLLLQLDYTCAPLMKSFKTYRYLSRFWTRFRGFRTGSVFFVPLGRGCDANCVQCGGSRYAQGKINHIREAVLYSHRVVLRAIRGAVENGYTLLYMEFETECSDGWYIQLLRLLKEEGIRRKIIFGAWRLPSRELLDAISEYADAIIVLSPETGDAGIRKKLKGGRHAYSNRELDECLSYISAKANLCIQIYFGYFLPGDTRGSVNDTMLYMLGILSRFPRVEMEYSAYTADPGSILHNAPDEVGVTLSAHGLEEYISYYKQVYLEDMEEDKPQDLRLFLPHTLSPGEAASLEREIVIFQRLLDLCGSACQQILEHCGREALLAVVIRLAEEITICDDEAIFSGFLAFARTYGEEDRLLQALLGSGDRRKSTYKKGAPPIYREL